MVYRLHAEDGTVLYVGRSCNVRNRIKAHHGEASSQYPGADIYDKRAWFFGVRRVSMVGPYTWDEAVQAERREIERLQPRGNRDMTLHSRHRAAP